MKCTITRNDGTSITRNSGSKAPLHPAVVAALPPTSARPNPEFSPPPYKCAEPSALSAYLFEWERMQKPKAFCDPDKDPQWRQNLAKALGEIKQDGGIRSHDNENGQEKTYASCPNCSQTIPRLYALAGMSLLTASLLRGKIRSTRHGRTSVRRSLRQRGTLT